jgi:hypothetical protein
MGRFFAGLILLSGVAVAAWAQNPIDAQIEAVKRLQDERKAQELQQQAEYQHQARPVQIQLPFQTIHFCGDNGQLLTQLLEPHFTLISQAIGELQIHGQPTHLEIL